MDTDNLLTLLVLAIGVFVYWRKGGNSAASEVIEMYKNRDTLQDKQLTDIKHQLERQTGEIGRLNGVIEEKDKRLQILEDIAKNRNPEMAEFMRYITKVAAESEKRMAKTDEMMAAFEQLPGILVEIRDFMQKTNEHFADHSVTARNRKV